MISLFPGVLFVASLLISPQDAPKPASLMDSLKQFEGHWMGNFTMGTMKMDVDMVWKPFGGNWDEVAYTYSNAKTKLEYRVMMTPKADNSEFGVWMFGNDARTPDPMKGVMDGKTLNILHDRNDQFIVKFSIDDQKNMIMSVVTSDAKHTEIAHGKLTAVKN